ncbi:uncharacterized protein STEHIDRAFT_182922 [Stereum hirsutum FP-91666 SS1]|uniref:uncharacterized protein n=1 Tax=Stereum hirsutum (strain FP-91666) TaxID=721885 RepID=UPI000440F6D3|nr:uncharacterized protein STEHIDRAFT_182922 [Stereum hirsutum FP-91666 SS1]EIM91694.1 hypothetical protein STEHIDRAFT_182922 [Stereum hirsutum FP-91666 SS1]
MLTLSRQLVCLVVLATGACSAPSGSSTSSLTSSPPETSSASTSVSRETRTVSPASTASNAPAYTLDADGANILGPMNIPLAQQNPDVIAPPTTDHGVVPNAKWPFALSHQRLQSGGWARQQSIHEMPVATPRSLEMDMRLKAGAIRELHWHQNADWAYVLKGSTQISSMDENGRNYLATVGPGDLWYFPPGIPHSLKATAESDEGSEFLLVFGNGSFSMGSTFLLTDWLSRVPKGVIAKNFQLPQSTFDTIPSQELYIFPGDAPDPNASASPDPQGEVPQAFSYPLSQVAPQNLNGGPVKIVDSTRFPISKTIAVVEFTIEPGAMRKLHWHPTQDEWSFFLCGNARMTVFAAESNARTFDYQAGDIGYVPAALGHYVENIGNDTLHFLEILKTGIGWPISTPPALVKAHLGLPEEVIAGLVKTKQYVVGSSA